MSPATVDRRRASHLRLFPEGARVARPEPVDVPASFDPRPETSGGGRLTLEQRLDRVWEGLLVAGAAECPMCAGTMGVRGASAECRSCGTTMR